MSQPSQLFLEEQVFSRSYSSFLEELSVWYFLPSSDAKDALQTADVKCLEGLDVSSIEGLCLTTVQNNWDTNCPVNGHFSGYVKVVIEEDTFCQSAEVLDFAVQAAAVTQYVTQVYELLNCFTFERVSLWTEKERAGRSWVTTDDKQNFSPARL